MNIEHLLSRERRKDYGCNEFACEAWQFITGEDLRQRLDHFLNGKGKFERLDEPISPCIAFFKWNNRSSTHVGLFFDNKILHLGLRGAQLAPLQIVESAFLSVEYFR